MIEKIKLGSRVKDKITGITGIAIARCEWLYGCIRVTIQPEYFKEGEAAKTDTFDEEQLTTIDELVGGVLVPVNRKKKVTGGDQTMPSRSADVTSDV